MPSIGTVTISHAASAASQQNTTANAAAKDKGAGGSTPNQNALLSQVAAQKVGQQVADDKQRGLQVPKRTEAGFSSNQDEEHNDPAKTSKELINQEQKQTGDKSKLDITA